jgi:hypothetical protein
MVRAHVRLDEDTFCLAVLPAWEQSFALHFTRTDFAEAVTVGDIWAVVQRRLVGNDQLAQQACGATQRTFYRLRHGLMSFGHPRAALTPQSRLQALFPLSQRRQRWQQFQRASGLPLPALRVPVVGFLLLWAIATMSVGGIAPSWGMALLTGLSIAVVLRDCPLLHVALPAPTLGGLTTTLVYENYHSLLHPSLLHNRLELRGFVLAGLAKCGAESEALLPDELQDGTVVHW